MFTYYKKTYKGIVLATLLAMPVGYLIGWVMPLGGWIGFILEAGAYVLVFGAAMYFLGLNAGEKAKINHAVGKILKKRG